MHIITEVCCRYTPLLVKPPLIQKSYKILKIRHVFAQKISIKRYLKTLIFFIDHRRLNGADRYVSNTF